ncbi:hypothetical protein P154DRAFT_426427, partial [Amniculicola lignicola CBS 123094]
PLNIVCFLVLKRAYSCEIEDLICYYINYITKLEFLPAFKAAFIRFVNGDNICASFQGTSLVLYNLEAVILKLDIKLRTPTPPPALEVTT